MTRSKVLNYKSLHVVFLVAILLVSVLASAKKSFAIDDSYLKGRAIQLAGFSSDELVVEPKLIYNSPANQSALPDLLSPNERVVNLIDPKYSLFGITAVFEAPKYQIMDGKKSSEIYSFKRRVGDVLFAGGVELAKEDIVVPPVDSLESPATAGDNLIKITRVSVAQIDEFESVPYQTKKTNDPTINKGIEKVTQAGKVGQKKLTYELRREDGVEVSRTLINQEISAAPQDQLVLVGTKPVITVRCNYNDTVVAASAKYGVDPNAICNLMMKESNGHNTSVNPGGYYGLFQYELGFWADASKKAGYAGASWSDPTAQIYTTAYCFSHGLGGRW